MKMYNRINKKTNGFIKLMSAFWVLLILSAGFNSHALAESEASTKNTTENASTNDLAQSLEQLKAQVLQLNRELFILEEDLLFPASTQLSLFVSVDTGKFFTIDSVEVKIDGKEVAGFLYTNRQREALEQGGIQKLYLGNLKMGEYELTAIFTGIDPEGRQVKRAAQYQFEKEDEALMIELKVVDNTSSYRSQVVVEEWVL